MPMTGVFGHLDAYLAMLGALLLAVPIGMNREAHGKDIMGLRTFPLVSLGACAYVLLAREFLGDEAPDALARVLQGLMTGLGFIGGGAILKYDDHVAGTASAASIWVVGAIGAAAGLGYWGHAIALALINFTVMVVFGMIKKRFHD